MITGRYAPSPSGRMHLGNLLCCLLAWLSAKSKGGQVLLRIEDLDTLRCPRHFADAIVEDLAWLGLSADGPEPPVYQSERSEIYLHYYKEIAFTDGHLGPYAENLARDCGDFYLRRADGVFAYQLAVVVDDALMGVTEVVRGADLLSSTPRQLWLYRELGLQAPQFYHLPLLLAADGRRLSKRDGDQSLEHLRAKYAPEEIIGKLAFACGLQESPRPTTPAALAQTFDWAKVPKHDILLPEKLF